MEWPNTLGYLPTAKSSNSTVVSSIDSIEDLNKVQNQYLNKYNQYKDKGIDLKSLQPCLTTHKGKRGDLNHSNIFFIDIDSKEGVDNIIENKDKLFNRAKWIYFIQKSFSGKLHICGLLPQIIEDPLDWKKEVLKYTLATTHIIKKLYDIDYSSIEGALDTHSLNISQLLYISQYPIITNPLLSKVVFEPYQVEQLFELYPFFKEVSSKIEGPIQKDDKRIDNQFESLKEGERKGGKVCIDRKFKIGKYSGNDVRWRISAIAWKVFGERGKEWCDKYFYCGEGSIYSKSCENKDYYIDSKVLSWLKEQGYLKENRGIESNFDYFLESNQYLSDINEELEKFVWSNKKCAIQSPTGTGKSVWISEFAKKYKATIVVPFNTTNKLYKGINCVSSDDIYSEVKKNSANVLVWDQAVKNWNKIKDTIIILDESHTIFTDRRYRESAKELVIRLKEKEEGVIIVSATQEGEGKLIGIDPKSCVNIGKSRGFVDFVVINTINSKDNVARREYNLIRKLLKECDSNTKIVMFGDRYMERIYQQFVCEEVFQNETQKLKRDSDYTVDYKRVIEEERLIKRLTCCSCVAYNGLNFRNSEDIIVVTSIVEGETLKSEIIQQIGRFRCAKSIRVYCFVEKKRGKSVEEREKANNIKREHYLDNGLMSFDSETDFEVEKELEEYCKDWDLENLLKGIVGCGYISLRVREEEEKETDKKSYRLSLKLKKSVSDRFKEVIKSDEEIEFDKSEEDQTLIGKVKYNNQYVKQYKELIKKGISREQLREFIGYCDGNQLLDSIFDTVELCCRISSLDNRGWEEYCERSNRLISDLRREGLDYKGVNNTLTHNKKLREVIGCNNSVVEEEFIADIINFTGYSRDNFLSEKINGGIVVDKLIEWKKEESAKVARRKGEGGKKRGKANNIKRVLYNGKEYESCKALSSEINKSQFTISNWVKSGKVLIMK